MFILLVLSSIAVALSVADVPQCGGKPYYDQPIVVGTFYVQSRRMFSKYATIPENMQHILDPSAHFSGMKSPDDALPFAKDVFLDTLGQRFPRLSCA